MRHRNNLKGSQLCWSSLHVSVLLNHIARDTSVKATQYMSSPRPSFLERLMPWSLLERLSSPISPCSMIVTQSECSVMPMCPGKEPARRLAQSVKIGGTNEQKRMKKMSGVMSQSTNDLKSIPSCSPG